jgi:ketosteroid isomerase-like protein
MRALIVAAFILAICSNAFSQRTVKKPGSRPKPNVAAQQRQATEAEDKEAIEQLHHDDIAASLAFDVDKLTATWDDEVVSMPPNSKPLVGKAANHEYLLSQQKALANVEILGYEETWDELRIIGDYAYEYGAIRSRIRQVNAQDETPLEYNVMRVLKKQPTGIWKIYRTIWNDRKASETKKSAD